jgi:hypothetical protein
MTIALAVIFGLLGLGMVLVVHGTIAKTRWGINLTPVSCPKCGSPVPQVRHPENAQQALWGGGTCVKCGAEVDKWGREVNARGHLLAGVLPGRQVRPVVKRRLIVGTTAGFFCLALLFAWLGVGDHPSTLIEWVAFVGVAAVETALFSVLLYAALKWTPLFGPRA